MTKIWTKLIEIYSSNMVLDFHIIFLSLTPSFLFLLSLAKYFWLTNPKIFLTDIECFFTSISTHWLALSAVYREVDCSNSSYNLIFIIRSSRQFWVIIWESSLYPASPRLIHVNFQKSPPLSQLRRHVHVIKATDSTSIWIFTHSL